MRMHGLVAVCLLAVGVDAQKPACTIPASVPPVKNVTKGIVYEKTANGGQTTLDLYMPDLAAGSPPPPLVLVVHGGGWTQYAGPAKWAETSEYLAHYGYAVANVQYRLAVPEKKLNQFPAGLQDLRCAVRYLRANAAALGFDGRKVGALGGSAGGNLVEMLGVLPGGTLPAGTFEDIPECLVGVAAASSSVDAVAAYYPVTSMGTHGTVPEGIRKYVGDADPKLAMPQPWVEERKFPAAPEVVVNGSADTLVPPTQGSEFVDALKKRGVQAQYFRLEGLPHGFGPFDVKQYPVVEASACATLELFRDTLK